MDTKLKKGKITRAVLYRCLTWVMLFYLLICVIALCPKLDSLTQINYEYLLQEDMNAFPEFREKTANLFTNLLFSTFGVGDENGNLLEESGDLSRIASIEANKILGGGGYYYCILDRVNNEVLENSFPCTVFSAADGHLVLPEEMELCYYWNGYTSELKSGPHYDTGLVGNTIYRPRLEYSENCSIVVAVQKQPEYWQRGSLLSIQQDIMWYGFLLRNIIAAFSGFAIFCLLSFLTRKNAHQGCKGVAKITGYVLPEIKCLLLLLLFCVSYLSIIVLRDGVIVTDEMKVTGGIVMAVGCGAIFWILLNDLVKNGIHIFYMSITAIVIRALRKIGDAGRWEKKYIVLTVGSFVVGLPSMISGAVMLSVYYTYMILNNQGRIRYYDARFDRGTLAGWGYPLFIIGLLLLVLCIVNASILRRESSKIASVVGAMRNGYLNSKLFLSRHAYLSATANDINELEKGIEQAVEQKSRADKMQVELITNVSHDLKTPLTSIINYADLLCEEPLPDTAHQYAVSIQEKSYHLKQMVQEVFELSKATTGNLVVEKTILDINKLLHQTLADIDEKIEQSSLIFKAVIPETPIYVEGDGDKLYRVFLNLYVNAISYSLENSRVYTQVRVNENLVEVRIKNTSKNELDFDTDEIMERFVRADKSRTSEGSGLGLSIAKSFTEACGGSFGIETDADMFTAIVTLPIVQTEESDEIQENRGNIES